MRDPGAWVAGLPGGEFEGTQVKPARAAGPVWYDPVVKHWLPVHREEVAPDGLSYLWVQLLPVGSNLTSFESSELHRYDLKARADHILWTYAGSIEPRWDPTGIAVDTFPPTGGQQIEWRINPETGAVTQLPAVSGSSGPMMLPGDQRNGGFEYARFGTDAQGHTLYRIGTRTPGDREWIFYESAPGQRVTIYRGTQGDTTGIDPAVALGDATGIWFSDYEMHGIWHWDAESGLRKTVVKGLPGLLSGSNSAIYVDPAGACA
jgi:hypothetical protein